MNQYPFSHDLGKLLKINCVPSDYLDIISRRPTRRRLDSPEEQAYQQLLPTYVYARCPICGTACVEAIDTYSLPCGQLSFSLKQWEVPPHDYPMNYPVPCSHYLGTHDSFINLHEQIPAELTFMITSGEVPFITSRLVPDDVESYAVLHAIPVCRIDGNVFLPYYTRYIVTYFSLEPRLLIDRWYQEYLKNDYYMDYLVPIAYLPPQPLPPPSRDLDFIRDDNVRNYHQQHYDLEQWVKKGKLGWLDFDDANLPLVIGRNAVLPDIYKDILGRRYHHSWSNGNLSRGLTWVPLNV